tara:strand:- start:863 stop:1255 length:393 start_codon:yes stop_codon:yes gene_type:complete
MSKEIILKKDCALTRLMIDEIEKSDNLLQVLKSWQEVGYLHLIPSYQDNRDLKNEKFRAVINAEQYGHTITMLRDELALLRQVSDDFEEVPDEELYEDGELMSDEVQNKIIRHVLDIGDWKLMRRKTNEL